MDRATWITRQVRAYDRDLYCEKSKEGKLYIFRNSSQIDTYDLDGITLRVSRATPFFVCALTDNWKAGGAPRDWGYFPLMNRLRQMDLWHRDIAKEQQERSELVDKQRARDQHNQVQDFMSHNHSRFKKDFSDIRTCNMQKKENKRSKSKWEL